jgi:hypothetical protein
MASIVEEDGASSVAFEIALEEYFKLKNKYEASVRKQAADYKKKAAELGLSPTPQQINSAVKTLSRCVNCSRPVGTIFSLRDRTYIAKCGDYRSPCSLDIRIKRIEAENAESIREQLMSDIREMEEKVIQLKMDLLFQYITEDTMVSKFYELRKEHQQFSDVVGQLTEQLNERRAEKGRIIETEERELVKLVEEIQAKMREYGGTNNLALLKEILSLYEDELMPTLRRIRETKYDTMRIEQLDRSGEVMASGFREQDKAHDIELVLVRADNTLEANEIISEEPEVLAYTVDKKRRATKRTTTPRQKKTATGGEEGEEAGAVETELEEEPKTLVESGVDLLTQALSAVIPTEPEI